MSEQEKTIEQQLAEARVTIGKLEEHLSSACEDVDELRSEIEHSPRLHIEPHQITHLQRVLSAAREQTGLAWELSAIDELSDFLGRLT